MRLVTVGFQDIETRSFGRLIGMGGHGGTGPPLRVHAEPNSVSLRGHANVPSREICGTSHSGHDRDALFALPDRGQEILCRATAVPAGWS